MDSKGIIIAAVADNGVIGLNNKMPWTRIPQDMKRFRDLTLGHAVLMGRKTYASLGKPLNGRLNVVLTRDNYAIPNTRDLVTFGDMDNAIKMCEGFRQDGVFYVIGGSDVYRQTIGLVDRMEITHVNQKPEGDSFFPELDLLEWRKIASEIGKGYEFATYERRKPN